MYKCIKTFVAFNGKTYSVEQIIGEDEYRILTHYIEKNNFIRKYSGDNVESISGSSSNEFLSEDTINDLIDDFISLNNNNDSTPDSSIPDSDFGDGDFGGGSADSDY